MHAIQTLNAMYSSGINNLRSMQQVAAMATGAMLVTSTSDPAYDQLDAIRESATSRIYELLDQERASRQSAVI